ncbi:MAG: sigma-54 dependent transcriptional regulator [Candidatus Cardinium sp.]|nr:sigma-54 dependent transcriptional regulator [Candidatus Cardinium sp.]
MKESIEAIKQRFHIIGNASSLNRAIEVAIQVASTDLSVLITGESGTGKESFSKIIHALSPYRRGNFIAINCGAIPEGTIDSELFGHEKGSFTGALESRKGYFEETNEGTIFLDEIGEMPLATQTKLLRVLEYGEYVKVGSSRVEKTKVRVVTATHVNLLYAIKEGTFREDLYYRLNTVPITIPPLRERGADVILLLHKFASDFAAKYRIKPLALTPAAKELFLTYAFPGNIRQLKNIVEQMALLEKEIVITPEVLEKYLPSEAKYALPVLYKKWMHNGSTEKAFIYGMLLDLKREVAELKELILHPSASPIKQQGCMPHVEHFPAEYKQENFDVPLLDRDYSLKAAEEQQPPATAQEPIKKLSIEAQEQALIRRSLQKNHGNRKHAADDLGISERTLYRKIKQYEIEAYSHKPKK